MVYFIGILMTVAWIWLIVIAFHSGRTLWGIVMILFVPAALLFGLLNLRSAFVPLLLFLIAIGLMFSLSPEQVAQFQQG